MEKVWRIMRYFLCCLIIFGVFKSFAQQEKFITKIYKPSVKTLEVYVEGNVRSYPVIEFMSEDKIVVQFDDLVPEAKDYSYRLIHCNYDWSASELFSEEFMEGFNENEITQYDYAINTKQPYVNYRVSLPNENVQFKQPGNYILKVIENGTEQKTVLTARFVIYEPLMDVAAKVVRPIGAEQQDNSQELELSVFHDQVDVSDPFNEVKVVVTQNNRPDRVLKDIKPAFVKNSELVYGISGDNILPGGNEFRIFAFTNIHKFGLNVNDIQYVDSIYHVQLRLDERRSFKRYFWEEDMNGKSFVFLDKTEDAHIAADYAYVYFSLPIEEPFLEGKVYLYGDFNHWQKSEDYQLQYNFDTKMYETKLLLKQGYYNYIYCYENNYTKEFGESFLEGSHFQTENDYLIYVYHRKFGENFDRLVGYQVVNSKYQD